MKNLLFLLATIFAASCTNQNKNNLDLLNIQENNPEISEISPGTGFENEVLRIQPHSKNQRLVIWEGEDASVWEEANYLVCEVWHANDFSGVLNLEFFRNQKQGHPLLRKAEKKPERKQ